MKRSKQQSLDGFFKRPNTTDTSKMNTTTTQLVQNTSAQQDCQDKSEVGLSSTIQSEQSNSVQQDCQDNSEVEKLSLQYANSNDIGKYVNISEPVDSDIKYDVIKNPWIPPANYKFPYSEHKKKGKNEKRYLSHKHLNEFEWVVYSDINKGLFCKYCVFFSDHSGNNRQLLQRLVKKPLISFAKIMGNDGDLSAHNKIMYHRNAVSSSENFCKIYENPNTSITNRLAVNRAKTVEDNRNRLRPIIRTIIFLGRQNIPLRGNNEDVNITENIVNNDGNFRQLIKYRSEYDFVLAEHLKNAKSNATYISKTTQNQIIEACGLEINNIILKRIEEAKYYSIIFEETTDISTVSQLSICLPYVFNNERHEDFIEFLNVHETAFSEQNSQEYFEPKITGKIIGQLVLEILKKYNLNPLNCIGIGTDGCSMMISEQIGAVKEIQKVAINAFRCPCFSHALNLTISRASTVRSIRNSIGTVKEVISFFSASAKRMYVLNNIACAGKFTKMCETRWVERIESLADFTSGIGKLVEAFDIISNWDDSATASKAKNLENSIINIEFIVSMHCQVAVLFLFLPISIIFQRKTVDVANATSSMAVLLTTLNKIRENAESEFDLVFSKIKDSSTSLEILISTPRVTKRQIHRDNTPSECPKDYYRRTVYIPMIDAIILDLKDRFSGMLNNYLEMDFLIPKQILSDTLNNKTLTKKIEHLYDSFKKIFDEDKLTFTYKLYSELLQWKETLKNSRNIYISETLEKTLPECDQNIYPTI